MRQVLLGYGWADSSRPLRLDSVYIGIDCNTLAVHVGATHSHLRHRCFYGALARQID